MNWGIGVGSMLALVMIPVLLAIFADIFSLFKRGKASV